jgi:hypothetical protein
MRIDKARSVVGGAVLLLGALACDNSRLPTMNTNPNSPTTAPAGPLFTRAVEVGVTRWMSGVADLRGTEWVTQHLAEVQYPNEDQYNRLQGADTQGTFNTPYSSEMEDFTKVISAGETANDPTIWGPATVMLSWEFENLTDMFGDIPYSEALKGDSVGSTVTPKYDRQQDIYAALIQRLADAAAAMKAGPTSSTLGSADVLYNGDMTKWVKFANSLRARLALRMVNIAPDTAGMQLAAALAPDAGGVITSNDDNATMMWPGDGTFDNPWADNFKGRDDHRMSKTFMDVMLALDDPRIPIFAQPVADSSIYPGGYGGMPNGLTQDSAAKWFSVSSRLGAIFYPGATSYGTYGSAASLATPSYLFTAAEMDFIKAEADERGLAGLSPASAAADYTAGITASMEQWGVSSDATTAFLAHAGVPYAGGTDGLVQIATQKWVALFTDGNQAWAEWRRTCIPVTVKAGPAALVSYVPRRYEYSITETQVNGASVDAALSQMGGPDSFATRMWWDSNPGAAPTYNANGGQCNVP